MKRFANRIGIEYLKFKVVFLLYFSNSHGLTAQPGSLDLTFSQDGQVVVSIERDYGKSVLIQPDGKIVVAGTTRENQIWKFALLRFNSNGTLDNSFDEDGKLTVAMENTSAGSCEAWQAILQPDGKIVVCGNTSVEGGGDYDWAILRVNANGTIDNTFSGDGKLRLNLSSNGSFDQSRALTYNNTSGKITVVGNVNVPIGLVRLNPNGSLDNTFGSSGKVIASLPVGFPIVYSAIQQNDSIWVGGEGGPSSMQVGFVGKFIGNGILDPNFGVNGFGMLSLQPWKLRILALCKQPDDKILATGSALHNNSDSSDIFIGRFLSNGQPDQSFGTDGVIILDISSRRDEGWEIMYDSTRQRILVAGYSEKNGSRQFLISRFYSDGQLDNEFGSSGTILTTVGVNWSECQAATLQPDGKIVCAGDIFNGASYDFALTRHIQDVVSGLDDLEHNPINTLTVSPNPADQEVYFQYSLSQKSYVSAEIRDAMGRLKKSLLFQDERIPGNYTEVFNAVDLLSGVYFLKLSTSDDKSRICRFVKK